MDWIWYILLLALMLMGLFANILGLPGLWLLVAAVAGYAWLTGFDVYVGWASLLALVALGLVAEAIEFVAGGAGAKAAGGSRRAMMGGIIGAIIGGIFLSILPIPIISTIFGACLGAFIGASLVELSIRRNFLQAARVGTGAAKGRFWGIVYKSAVGVLMFFVGAVAAFPIASSSPSVVTGDVRVITDAQPTAAPSTMSGAPATTPTTNQP